ncbi:MAG: DUF1552 domain-containing protein [Planctomycetota bacterium]|nr:DUF1552 domain-containing protein [Planctomycetota bacterium]MEC8734281.1 DUF1552 domain-containing protein [Planctomycetota bacterium]MEC8817659.1 DUF1552 domain-containing protein [Planctomycetota bacterium]MEC9157367.1 DUF1552 domain-containing protein [Planctomycetota bacterium]
MHPNESNRIDRRTVLRGMGAAIALPWLEVMTPDRFAAAGSLLSPVTPAAASPLRCAFLFIPNGVDVDGWYCSGEGADYQLSGGLAPLAPMREKFSILAGLDHRNAKALGDGPGDHARSAACFLTGAHPYKTAGRDLQVGVSVDQFAARHVGGATTLPSLEIGCEPALQSGNCDSGYSCAYSANISWRSESQPNLKEIRPRDVFERLFGFGPAREAAPARQRRLATRKSILDFVREDTRRLVDRLGSDDRHRLGEYTESVRAVERRIQRYESETLDPEAFESSRPVAGIPADYREHVSLMNDMLVLAFRIDQTRIASFMLANEGSNRRYPFIGVDEGHHHLSHHKGDPAMIDKIRRINHYQSEVLLDLLTKMESVKEHDGTLLDNSMLLFGSAIADGNRHNHDDLPVILAGGGRGTLSPGRLVRHDPGTPMCNLFVSMLQRMGVDADSFGDSNGALQTI